MILENDFNNIEGRDYGMVILLWAFLYLIRLVMIFILSPLLSASGYSFNWKHVLVMAHGGLRGAVSLALGLAVSLDIGEGGDELPDVVKEKTLFYAGMKPVCLFQFLFFIHFCIFTLPT